MLIGNLTRDPELRYTPAGMAVVTFGLATNRVWSTKQGEKKEDAQFHRIVAWNKLAELCSQLLVKGRRIFVEGRIQYREFTDSSGQKKQVAEIVIDDMIVLDNKGVGGADRGTTDTYSEAQIETGESGAETAMEDIVIPDEAVAGATEEQPKAEPVAAEEPAKAKKDEEMPF